VSWRRFAFSPCTAYSLQFARAEAAPEPVKLTSVNVDAAAQSAVRREGVDGAEIRVDVDPLLIVRANEEHLVRSLSNLLRNAIRYAGDAGPITASAHHAGPHIKIAVADSGPAGRVKTREQLLLEVADRAFEVFDRSIDVHVSSLRKKLGDDAKNPRYIETVRSAGYRLKKPETH
jgi:K+-sensing histidine kinase KdpD